MSKLKRRANNEGTIRQRTDGRWEARVSLGINPATGRMRMRSFYGHTREEAQVKLREAQNQLANDEYVTPSGITFAQWLWKWHAMYVEGHLKPRTVQSYKVQIRANIIPALGAAKLQKLRREDMQRFVNDLSKTHAPSSVSLIMTVARSALKQAVKGGLIRRNPADDLVLPAIHNEKKVTLTQPEVMRFFDALPDSTNGRILAFIALTGMRIGEASALHWGDVGDGSIRVEQSVAWLGDGAQVPVFNTPKSNAGIRTIPLNNAIRRVLEAQRRAQLEERMRAGKAWNDYGLIFSTPLGLPLREYPVNRTMHAALEVAGISDEFTPHDLRHAWATAAMKKSKNNAKMVSTMLGHSSVTMTLNRYTHPDMDEKQALMEDMFNG